MVTDHRGGSSSSPFSWLPSLLLLLLHSFLQAAFAGHYPIAGLSTRWTNRDTTDSSFNFKDGSYARSLLLRQSRTRPGPAYACGFYSTGGPDTFFFSIFIVQVSSAGLMEYSSSPQVVWAANRARPVGENATVELGTDGNLVLADADGSRVWSANTSGRSVAGVNLTEFGNLVLFGGDKNDTIWESFASPTDTLVPGQKLWVGQSLKASASATNWTEGPYFLSATSTGLTVFVKSDPPIRYASLPAQSNGKKEIDYLVFMDGSVFTSSSEQYMPPTQFLRLESDGRLRVYKSYDPPYWFYEDLLSMGDSDCFSPTVCGRYGICSAYGQCGCPSWGGSRSNYFAQIDGRKPSLGCEEVAPLSCESPGYDQSLLRLDDVSYFTYNQSADIPTIDQDGCRSVCEKNCSCKAAFFRYSYNTSHGSCYLAHHEVFSLKSSQDKRIYHYNSTAFIKVQIPVAPTAREPGTLQKGVILGLALGAAFLLLLVLGFCILIASKKIILVGKRDMVAEHEEDDLERVSGIPRRFSLEELRAITDGFYKMLGQGGFGSVYEGRMRGKKVAVKRLDGVSQGRKEFMAEVETIGKIHHVNLVKLIGYCAEKSHRLLVYEFMPNGSLDRWIFSRDQKPSLGWQTRCKIILGVAKGLSYLHEECSQRIAHLDIKPQNILLDAAFEAKVADFGLAKLIERDQTHVETRMRGTPGYMAPEWLSSMITEKVDVYSFGVVVLEIICGRRSLDRSRPEEDALLVSMVKRKTGIGEVLDLVDESIKDTDFHVEEAVKMIKIAMWCLRDRHQRPSMSMVVKVLEGLSSNAGCNFEDHMIWAPYMVECSGSADHASSSAPLLASVLSGPR